MREARQQAFNEEAQQLDLMQQKIMRLRAQLQELEVLTAGRGVQGRRAAVSPSGYTSPDDSTSEGLGCKAGSFSRQTTAECDEDSFAPVPFSRQTSSGDEDGDAWENVAAIAEAVEPCEFVVKRTFLSLEPVRAEGQRRRSKSAPPAAAYHQGAPGGMRQ